MAPPLGYYRPPLSLQKARRPGWCRYDRRNGLLQVWRQPLVSMWPYPKVWMQWCSQSPLRSAIPQEQAGSKTQNYSDIKMHTDKEADTPVSVLQLSMGCSESTEHLIYFFLFYHLPLQILINSDLIHLPCMSIVWKNLQPFSWLLEDKWHHRQGGEYLYRSIADRKIAPFDSAQLSKTITRLRKGQ